ncbi:MAG: Crp/Fnr family transcriptional regulator [Chitinophagaceae bacterium]
MTIDHFINYLLQFDTLNAQQIELIRSLVETKTYYEGDMFLKAGKVSNAVGFILDGVFRVCYYDQDGNEITRYFLDEGNFVADLNGYVTGIPSTEYVQAVTDCELLTISKQSMEELSRTVVVWDKIVAKITAKALSEKVARVSAMMPQEANERYAYFLEHFPQIANRVPLQYIASYIGITKSSMSRIRRAYAKR